MKPDFRSIAILAAIFGLLAAGCSSAPPPEERSSGELEGGFLGLEGEQYAFWEEWTPRSPAAMSPNSALKPATVFDAWRLEESSYRSGAWDTVFHLLASLNTVVDDRALSRGIESVMLRLEPAVDDAVWELAFVSHETGQAEGIVLRIAASDGAGLWLEAWRRTDESNTPGHWTLRVEPAAEESAGVTAAWTRRDDQWTTRLGVGADATDQQLETVEMAFGQRFVELLIESIWEPVTGRSYVEPDFEPGAHADEPLADGWPAALGRPVEERGLEDFVTDTVFIP